MWGLLYAAVGGGTRRAAYTSKYTQIFMLSSTKFYAGQKKSGGESGIRTHDTVSRIHAFQACAFSHSAISPAPVVGKRKTEPRPASPFHSMAPRHLRQSPSTLDGGTCPLFRLNRAALSPYSCRQENTRFSSVALQNSPSARICSGCRLTADCWRLGTGHQALRTLLHRPPQLVLLQQQPPVNACKNIDQRQARDLHCNEVRAHVALRRLNGQLVRRRRSQVRPEVVPNQPSQEKRQRQNPQLQRSQSVGYEQVIGRQRAERIKQARARRKCLFPLQLLLDGVNVLPRFRAQQLAAHQAARRFCQDHPSQRGCRRSHQRQHGNIIFRKLIAEERERHPRRWRKRRQQVQRQHHQKYQPNPFHGPTIPAPTFRRLPPNVCALNPRRNPLLRNPTWSSWAAPPAPHSAPPAGQ